MAHSQILRSIGAGCRLPGASNARLTSPQPAHEIESSRDHPSPTASCPLVQRQEQQILDLFIGVRSPGGNQLFSNTHFSQYSIR